MSDDAGIQGTSAHGSVWLSHASGLHARPAIKLTKLAKRFQSSVTLGQAQSGPWKDAKSIAQVLSLKAPHGTTLYFQAHGSDAQVAVDALIRLVDSDFEAPNAGGGVAGALDADTG